MQEYKRCVLWLLVMALPVLVNPGVNQAGAFLPVFLVVASLIDCRDTFRCSDNVSGCRNRGSKPRIFF